MSFAVKKGKNKLKEKHEDGKMRDIYENFDIIPKDKKVVIWGIGQKSGEIFCETLNRKIEITYFVDATGDFADTKEQLFGKTILSKEELLGRINEKNDLFILIVKEYSSSDDMKWIEKYCKGMYYLCDTSDIDLVIRNSKRLYLYGGGEAGKRTYRLLKEYGIKVNAFIDSDCKKWNKRIDDNIDVMVYGPELIEKNDIIVISTRYYFEIRSLLTEKGIPEKNIFVDIRNSAENSDVPLRYRDGVRLWFEDMEHRTLRFIEWRHFFWMAFIDFYKRKRIILYGVNEFTTHFLCLFHLLKIEVIYCIDNIDNSRMMKKLGININYRNLCEVAYEDMEDKIVYVIKGGGQKKE